jgi:hypothetical protein
VLVFFFANFSGLGHGHRANDLARTGNNGAIFGTAVGGGSGR